METAYAVWSEPPRQRRGLASPFFRNMHLGGHTAFEHGTAHAYRLGQIYLNKQ